MSDAGHVTRRLVTDGRRIDPAVIAEAAEVLRRGGLVAFPTETVYGLGANALDRQAVAGIFAAKGRPARNPVIVHVADVAAARQLARRWPVAADRLAERFWPGPLTIIVPKAASIPDLVTAGGDTVGLRVPAHAVAQALVRAAGLPVAAPSANVSTQVSPTLAEHVLAGLDGRIDCVLDAGPAPGGLESTVIDVARRVPVVLRPGLVTMAELRAVLGKVEIVATAADSVRAAEALRSPGLLARHYAPRVPLELGSTAEVFSQASSRAAAGERVGCLSYGHAAAALPAGIWCQVLPAEAVGYAAELYAALHRFERGTATEAAVERILVVEPPEGDAWLAIWDRLRRAAHA